MKVLFVVGYQKEPFNINTWLSKGLGGSEYCVIKLAHKFLENGHSVMIAGNVESTYTQGVNYLTYQELKEHHQGEHFDVVIAINYIHYIKELEESNITYNSSYFWIHNMEFYPYWNGLTLENNGINYLEDPRLTNIIAVSDYQANKLEKKYPQMLGKIKVIENAIDPDDFIKNPSEKEYGKFVYTSSAERGLENLLNIWPKIKELIPNATLWVATPPYALDVYENYKGFYDGVHFVDNLPPSELYKLINSAEYWLYPSKYDETYCITALEMMMGEVKILSTDSGNLLNLLQGKAHIVSDINYFFDEFKYLHKNTALQSLNLKNAKLYAEKQNWNVRFQSWMQVIEESNTSLKLDCVYIIALEENFDQESRWMSELKKFQLDPRTPVVIHKAVNGSRISQDWMNQNGYKKYQNWKLPNVDTGWYGRDILPGELGCAISHITVWEDALKNNYENILVLEEDFQVLDRFLVDDFKSLPSDWDLFYLGKNTLSGFEDIETELPRIKKSAPSYNTHAYLLNKSGIKKLLSKPFKQNLFTPDDFFIATYSPHPYRNDLGFIESDVNAYTLRNDLHICVQTNNFKTSTTENIHKMNKLHPELYSFHENLEAWVDRFVTYSAKTKEWDLISDEPFDNVFLFPLFTSEFCTMVREEAEYVNNWTLDRHANYPTTDMLLDTLGLHDVYMEVLRRYVMPFSIYMWGLEGKGWDKLKSENFLAKYTPNAQGHLSIHHDSSDITCLVQLSDISEYEGGGTWFWRQKKLVKSPIGYCTIHPGNITHKHGARAVSNGVRYIIVSFMNNLERY